MRLESLIELLFLQLFKHKDRITLILHHQLRAYKFR